MVCRNPLDGALLLSGGGRRADGKNIPLDVSHLWDYGSGALSVMGLIRLDYAPLWAVLGLFFEEVCWFMRQEAEERG